MALLHERIGIHWFVARGYLYVCISFGALAPFSVFTWHDSSRGVSAAGDELSQQTACRVDSSRGIQSTPS